MRNHEDERIGFFGIFFELAPYRAAQFHSLQKPVERHMGACNNKQGHLYHARARLVRDFHSLAPPHFRKTMVDVGKRNARAAVGEIAYQESDGPANAAHHALGKVGKDKSQCRKKKFHKNFRPSYPAAKKMQKKSAKPNIKQTIQRSHTHIRFPKNGNKGTRRASH